MARKTEWRFEKSLQKGKKKSRPSSASPFGNIVAINDFCSIFNIDLKTPPSS